MKYSNLQRTSHIYTLFTCLWSEHKHIAGQVATSFVWQVHISDSQAMFRFSLCGRISGIQESIAHSQSSSEPPDGYLAQI
jgi:hypothetical protein